MSGKHAEPAHDASLGTVVICTALGLERTAVQDHLDSVLTEREEREVSGTLYEIGTYSTRHGQWTIALTLTGPGNASAGIELERAIKIFSPQIVLFVGVAGGVREVDLGDVVIPNYIYDYQSIRDTNDGVEPRIKTMAPSHMLLQRAQKVADDNEWQRRIIPANHGSGTVPVNPVTGAGNLPRAVVKPIASGDAVIADQTSALARSLHRHCGAAVAVEMEGYGFLLGAHRNDGVHALVVRGISDLLSGKTETADQYWQPIAASHAAAFTFELLDQLRPSKQLPSATKRTAAYLHTVQRIAPKGGLCDRDDELAALERFCTDPDMAGRYWWWRAKAWSGKSALLSWFVLNPPAGVRIVSFFVTAGMSSQNHRTAFIENLLEQLLVLLGQAVPPLLTDSTREAHLLKLLTEAAEACRDRGEQFVLVVDGLDEDSSVYAGVDWHSIAGLLPVTPPAGMRVIVAGRADPPLPIDVDPAHPLYDPGVWHPLEPWPHARDLRAKMLRELHILLDGPPIGRDLLGLVVAARGGLSAADLAELTPFTSRQIERHLQTVAVGSFTSRPSHYHPATTPAIYVLAHEELDVIARGHLGQAELEKYRGRLHDWAQTYRDRGWGEDTPQYLLRGYHDMLVETGDLSRLVECAIDRERQERLLLMSSGDSTALTQIVKAIDLCAAEPTPDLNAIVRLAQHRDRLRDRNSNIPSELPAAWVLLGQIDRAEAIARSITKPPERLSALKLVAEAVARTGDHDRAEAIAYSLTQPYEQVQALRSVTGVVVQAGDHDRVRTLLREAETIAHTITNLKEQTWALHSVAEAAAQAGDHDRAEAIVSITDPERQSLWLRRLAEAAAQAGDYDWAHALARTITNIYDRSCVLQSVAEAMAQAGDYDRAEALARSISDSGPQVQALRSVAEAMVQAGDYGRARTLLREAETRARSLTFDADQARALQLVAVAVVRAGEYDRAETIACSITDRFDQAKAFEEQARALRFVAEAMAKAGEYHRAETIARSITDRFNQAKASSHSIIARFDQTKAFEEQARTLQSVAEAAAQAGDYDRAETLARSIPHSEQQVQALRSLAEAMARSGDLNRARTLLRNAEALARSFIHPERQARALWCVGTALAKTGGYELARTLLRYAEALARSITESDLQARLLALVSEAAAQARDYGLAEALARCITDPQWQASLLALVVKEAARAGDFDRAEALARSFTDSYRQAQQLCSVAEAVAQAGDHDRAEALARSLAKAGVEAQALASVAEAVAKAGDHDRAEALARSLTEGHFRMRALSSVGVAVAQAGDHDRARTLLRDAEAIARSITSYYFQVQALRSVGVAVAQAGDHDRGRTLLRDAEAIARTFTEPERLQVLRSKAERDQAQSLAEAITGDFAEPERSHVSRSKAEYDQAQSLRSVAEAMAQIADYDRAEAIARSLSSSEQQVEVLRSVAEAMARAGDYSRARTLLRELEARARALTPDYRQAPVLQSVAEVMAQIGDYDRAEAIARSLEPDRRALALYAIIDHAGPDLRLRLLVHQVKTEEWYKSSRYLVSEAADAFYEGVSELATRSSKS